MVVIPRLIEEASCPDCLLSKSLPASQIEDEGVFRVSKKPGLS